MPAAKLASKIYASFSFKRPEEWESKVLAN